MSNKGESSATASASAALTELKPCGMLIKTDGMFHFVSFHDLNISQWLEPYQTQAVVEVNNLTIDFSHLFRDSRGKVFCGIHKGLALTYARDTAIHHVYNPVTPENIPLPKFIPKGVEEGNSIIINDSNCDHDTPCNFRVFAINNTCHMRCAQVYFSNNNEWDIFKIDRNKEILKDCYWMRKWNLAGAVFLDGTLYCLAGTPPVGVVGVILSTNRPMTAYSLDLPLPEVGSGHPTLLVSGGCLYVAYAKADYLGIWKYNGSPQHANPWNKQFQFNKNDEMDGFDLRCNPKAKTFLGKQSYRIPKPLKMHPQEPIVYIYRDNTISAFHLYNDEEVRSSRKLENNLAFEAHNCYLFSPCFASLEHINPPA